MSFGCLDPYVRSLLANGKVRFPSSQQTWLYNQSIFYFYFPTATCFGPHGTTLDEYQHTVTAHVIVFYVYNKLT
jgi:hypothetical protein